MVPLLGELSRKAFPNPFLPIMSLHWLNRDTGAARFDVSAFDLIGLDYLFVFAVIFGLYAMHRLLVVREEGEVEKGVVLSEFYGEVRKAVRHVSNVAGLRHLYTFPFARIEEPDESSGTTIDSANSPHDNDG